MTVTPGEVDILAELRRRQQDEGSVFWFDADQLAAFDPQVAQALNSANFDDLMLPEKVSDLIRGRRGVPVPWQDVRAVWIDQLRQVSLSRLADQMAAELRAATGGERDLVWVAHEVISRSLVPVVVDGLDARDTELVLRDQNLKLRFNVEIGPPRSRAATWRGIWTQARAGWVVRRELRGRASGRRPRRHDLTQPIADLLPILGMGRAVDAVTGLLTAISGPPGGAASALLYVLAHYPEWADQLTDELTAVDESDLLAAPTRAAPVTHRVVRETLRMWSPTPLMQRPARKTLEYDGVCVRAGQSYLLSPDILHHDPRFWDQPETFDPNRWLRTGERTAGCYAPFGWAPRGCIGAGLGTAQLILFCYLVTTRYRIDWADRSAVTMALPSMPVPQHLIGKLRPVDAS